MLLGISVLLQIAKLLSYNWIIFHCRHHIFFIHSFVWGMLFVLKDWYSWCVDSGIFWQEIMVTWLMVVKWKRKMSILRLSIRDIPSYHQQKHCYVQRFIHKFNHSFPPFLPPFLPSILFSSLVWLHNVNIICLTMLFFFLFVLCISQSFWICMLRIFMKFGNFTPIFKYFSVSKTPLCFQLHVY